MSNPTDASGAFPIITKGIGVGTIDALFTTSADTVNFNNLNPTQQAAVDGDVDLYIALGGGDTITLPNANPTDTSVPIAGTSKTFDLTQTFVLGDNAGDVSSVTGGGGSYKIALGVGSDTVNITGNGNSTITGGSGTNTIDTITINGTGSNTINLGVEAANITLTGSNNNIDFFASNETATLVLPDDFKENINGFTSGDTIDLKGLGDLTLSAVLNYNGVKNPGEVDLWSDGSYIGAFFFGSGVNYAQLEPLTDGIGGTELIVDPTPNVDNPPAGYDIDWGTVIKHEGGVLLEPYTLQGQRADHSGITVAAGVDLNNLGITQAQFAAALNLTVQQVQANPNLNFLYNEIGSIPNHTKTEIAAINARAISDLDAKTVPVTVGGGATKDLEARTISITQTQATELDNYAEQVTVNAMEAAWTVTTKDISDLDPSVQTALADVFYNQGAQGRAGVLAAITSAAQSTAAEGTPEWQDVWTAVVTALRKISDPRFNEDATDIQDALNLPVQTAATLEQTSGLPSTNIASVSFANTQNAQFLIDPSGSETYILSANPGSPAFSSIQLPTADDSGETYSVSFEIGAIWSAPQVAQPLQTLSVPTGVSSIEVTVLDPNGSGSGDFGFFVTFASSGTFSGEVIDLTGAVTVAVAVPVGINLTWASLYEEMANSPIEAGGSATQYTCADTGAFDGHTAPIQFVVTGSGFAYSGNFPNIQLTGGTITGIQELDATNNVLATFSGFSISATTFNAALSSYIAGGASPDPTALNAIFQSQTYEITAGAGPDVLEGGDQNNTIIGNIGNDTIDGNTGTSILDYSGLTTPGVIVNLSAGWVNKGGANGVDTITGIENFVDIGSPRTSDDHFYLTANDTVTADGSNFNYLHELSPGVTLTYGTNVTGITEFLSNVGGNTIDFSSDPNFAYIYGSTGNDTLTLGSGGGYVFGEGGTNVLNGGANATNFFEGGGGGSDTMNGGSGTASNYYWVDGNDQINGAGAFNAMVELIPSVTVQLGGAQYQDVQEFVAYGGNNTVTVASTDTDFVYLFGGSGNDTLSTGSGGGYLLGEGGTNVLTGGGGTNVFVADGASGVDTMNGGSGSNVYYIDNNSTVNGAGTSNAVVERQQNVSLSYGSAQLGTNIQEVVLNGGTNTVDFSADPNPIYLYGVAGNDTLFGGTGNDFLYGGSGTNTFGFKPGSGQDTIMDWTSGTNNQIDLTALASQGVHAITDLTQTIVNGSDVITSSHTGANSITLMGLGSTLTASSFHFA